MPLGNFVPHGFTYGQTFQPGNKKFITPFAISYIHPREMSRNCFHLSSSWKALDNRSVTGHWAVKKIWRVMSDFLWKTMCMI